MKFSPAAILATTYAAILVQLVLVIAVCTTTFGGFFPSLAIMILSIVIAVGGYLLGMHVAFGPEPADKDATLDWPKLDLAV